MKESVSGSMSLDTAVKLHKDHFELNLPFEFPWGTLDQLHVRELSYLRYVYSLPQPSRGTLILRLLGLKPNFTLRQRMSLIPNFVRLPRFSRTHLAEYMRRIELPQTGARYTMPT